MPIKMQNKKSQIFTIIAIVLILLLFASYEVYSYFKEREAIKTRISTMNSFLFSLEENLGRDMYIVGFRTLFLAQTEITKTGKYIPNINLFFNESFLKGSVNGQPSEILVGATFNDIQRSTNEKARKVNVNVTLSNPVISVSQEDPWNVLVTLEADFVMIDTSGLARWDKRTVIKTKIPIENFEDPLFILNTQAKVARKINRTIYEGIYNQPINNLNEHVSRGYYTYNPSAPSFLNRLEGNFGADENGIESLVYIPALSAQGIPTYEKSVVDYIYFSPLNPSSHQIEGMPSWFRLDTEHLEKYNCAA